MQCFNFLSVCLLNTDHVTAVYNYKESLTEIIGSDLHRTKNEEKYLRSAEELES
jgi:hypothetical protein